MLSTIPRRSNLVPVLLVFLHVSQAAVSSKKGLDVHTGAFKCGDLSLFTGVSWWFDWRSDQGRWAQCPHVPNSGYVPMIADEQALKTAVIPKEAKYVMGFNEPNGAAPEQIAQLWPLVQHKAGNRMLVSPAVFGCDADKYQLAQCIDWFDKFFKHCRNCRVDYIALHPYECNPTNIMQAVEELSRRFDKKVWLTRFRCWGNLHFMKTILPMLETSPHVEKYTWPLSQAADLIDVEHNQSKLSKMGQFYNNFHP